MQQSLKRTDLYLLIVAISGFAVVLNGLKSLANDFKLQEFGIFLLLIFALVAVAEIAHTSFTLKNKEITISVGAAVTMAVLPFFGPLTAGIASLVANLSMWLVKPKQGTWKGSVRQLAFNSGMHAISIAAGGAVFISLQNANQMPSFLLNGVAWIVAAVLYDQINFWLLMIMLRLQMGKTFKPLNAWQDAKWAFPIHITVSAVGGAVLAYAISNYDLVGILVFFLPVLLSAYAFRLYVSNMKKHMDNLEAIIEERNKERDSFLAVLSHDMKAPLTSVTLYADILQASPHLMVEKPHMVNAILRASRHLTAIVDDILELSSYRETGSIPLQKEQVDITAVVESVYQSMVPTAQLNDINLVFETATSAYVELDQDRVERVLYNLISNGIKYNHKFGSVFVSILEESPNLIIIKVCDTGVGIPEDKIESIFRMFYRVDEQQTQTAGTGVGLAASKIIVESHGGNLDVVSSVGHGSTFSVALPTST
ncbi:MAG: HAMP domain-containing sensor histidine kinase [Chloroflexota bacterium]